MNLILKAIKSFIHKIDNVSGKVENLSAQVKTVRKDLTNTKVIADSALSKAKYSYESIKASENWGFVSFGDDYKTPIYSIEVDLPVESSEIIIHSTFRPGDSYASVCGELYINDTWVGLIFGGASNQSVVSTTKVRVYGDILLSEQNPQTLAGGIVSACYVRKNFSKIKKVKIDFLSGPVILSYDVLPSRVYYKNT